MIIDISKKVLIKKSAEKGKKCPVFPVIQDIESFFFRFFHKEICFFSNVSIFFFALSVIFGSRRYCKFSTSVHISTCTIPFNLEKIDLPKERETNQFFCDRIV